MNQDNKLAIAFIGAGKVGTSLAKYFSLHELHLLGLYSLDKQDTKDAADFTQSKELELITLLTDADIIFITVPDDAISATANKISKIAQQKNISIKDKIFIHCSGSLSSSSLDILLQHGASTHSLHPMLAFADKYSAHKKLNSAHFTLEGCADKQEQVKALITKCGNPITIISANNKATYHLAAVNASNLVLALLNQSITLLAQCGFTQQDARSALAPLITNNIENILAQGTSKSLTGPIERADIKTVQKHLAILSPNEQQLYALLSKELVKIAESRHEIKKDYSGIISLLNEYIHKEEK